MADLYNQCLSDTPMCEHCIDSVEDAHHYFFTCSKYTTLRDFWKHFIQMEMSLLPVKGCKS